MNAAKKGYVAEFVTGYLQREIRELVKVIGGTDQGLRNPDALGIAVGRLVRLEDGAISPVNTLSTATHIVAQSDDTIRENPEDYNYQERYSNLPNLIVKNSAEEKTVALYKIVNKDDVKLIKIAEPVDILTATNVGGTFTAGPATFRLVQQGINRYKVLGTAPYVASPIVSGNPAGNYIYLKLVNELIKTAAAFNAALAGVDNETIVYKRISGLPTDNTETKSTIASEIGSNAGIECELCVNDTQEIEVDVMWEANVFSHYIFDLSELNMEVNG